MSTASPSAFLLWAILSVLFLAFLIYHLWSYDRFQCLRWSAGKQPGAFKRVMTYSYIATLPLLVVYSVATTAIKYNEGFIVYTEPGVHIMPRPPSMYSHRSRVWVLPLNFVFSIAWALELCVSIVDLYSIRTRADTVCRVTHLEELAFWLYLLNQAPEKAEWFESWEYRLWYLGSIVAILGLPLTCMIARRNLDTVDAWIFLAGSAGGLGTTVVFLYVLLRFPRFLRHVKAEGADPTVVVRLATNYQLNLARVVFRFLFAVPLLMLAIDGIVGKRHPLNTNLFSTDFLQMIGGIGCFVSSAITLLVGPAPISRISSADLPRSLARMCSLILHPSLAPLAHAHVDLLPALDHPGGGVQAAARVHAPVTQERAPLTSAAVLAGHVALPAPQRVSPRRLRARRRTSRLRRAAAVPV
ncbi:hypothetical protein WOLCODRAFT_126122, partial [Wolfiporia cocos MD-104 SS10]